jgi:hypothetical protein
MSQQPIITLLTDFGSQDIYVGVIKGVIAQINPQISVIDLNHEIPPQDLAAARFCLMNAYTYFPRGTIHVAVVDPGVGTQRRNLGIQLAEGYLIGPDNGIFSSILSLSPAQVVVELTNRQYWRTTNPSDTFHGRDIFASVAAHLANGISLTQLGEKIEITSLVNLPIPQCQVIDHKIIGSIQYIDRFGNLITNIPESLVRGKSWCLTVGRIKIPSHQTYGNVRVGSLLGLVGSHNWLEIAVNQGNAQQQLQLNLGSIVEVIYQ